ncbi:MAG: flagella basal body P-ring formation protein FlgA [Myxococcales bacterium]|nr:flagella basal body P-ring formation protein FlgA [Myxococcales bacterium]
MTLSKTFSRTALFFALGAIALVTSDASAAEVKERAVANPRVVLSDVVDGAPADLADIDLGPTPAPGSSRLIKREDIDAALENESDRKRVKLKTAVRVVRKTKALATTDLEKLASAAVKASTLPKGATFVGAKPKASVKVPDGYDDVAIELGKFPRREGKHTASATLVFKQGDEIVAKISVPVDFKLGPEAAIADVKKGEKVSFLVRRGQIEIRALATANTDADVGDTLQVTVSDSGKVLKGRVSSASPAIVLEGM